MRQTLITSLCWISWWRDTSGCRNTWVTWLPCLARCCDDVFPVRVLNRGVFSVQVWSRGAAGPSTHLATPPLWRTCWRGRGFTTCSSREFTTLSRSTLPSNRPSSFYGDKAGVNNVFSVMEKFIMNNTKHLEFWQIFEIIIKMIKYCKSFKNAD